MLDRPYRNRDGTARASSQSILGMAPKRPHRSRRRRSEVLRSPQLVIVGQYPRARGSILWRAVFLDEACAVGDDQTSASKARTTATTAAVLRQRHVVLRGACTKTKVLRVTTT